ncbi:NAD(P)/FAD-dependent oxidoreductase [Brucella intermedia]|uniref:NAD(P)/FAD-dependent oxidoreductase n=1 Tax=Brucella intermedia TaxID=94625 RepID=UPI00124CCC04|nr:FAD-dependent oxidoreductase [Brucella intermedia]KAB2711367.1 FAD-dependent oxidoreductase [Brucella intermedia]
MTGAAAARRADVLVLGAGIIGVCVALHLQKRGRSVVLVDRREPGEETSSGNAGLIERSSVVPYGVPREFGTLLRYGLNRSADVRFDWSYLPRIAPWLWRFWRESSPKQLARATTDMWPLIRRSVSEHELLAQEAGVSLELRKTGWIEAFRSEASFEKARTSAEALVSYGLHYELLDGAALRKREPHLSSELAGGIHWLDPATVRDPGALVKSYTESFLQQGGRFCLADASKLERDGEAWRLKNEREEFLAREVVIALGPWAIDLAAKLGYRMPFAVKRGYHVHFSAQGEAVLNRPIVDADGGFVLSPMRQGIRLLTGIEFAPRDSGPNYTQLNLVEPLARRAFPLDKRIEPVPWMGARPCLSDMRPVIGAGRRHKGLWFAFGHNHHGLTLGPVTGRLLAELMTGEVPFTDPAPYAISRFS